MAYSINGLGDDAKKQQLDQLKNAARTQPAAPPSSSSESGGIPTIAYVGLAAVAAYFIIEKNKKGGGK